MITASVMLGHPLKEALQGWGWMMKERKPPSWDNSYEENADLFRTPSGYAIMSIMC